MWKHSPNCGGTLSHTCQFNQRNKPKTCLNPEFRNTPAFSDIIQQGPAQLS